MAPDFLTYLGQSVAATLYALVLEFGCKRRYEPGYTWVAVVWGVAQVGLIVAARLAWAPVPPGYPGAVAWWVWWLVFWSFCAAGLPIITWQLILQALRWRQVQAAWESWNGNGNGAEQ